MKVNNPLSVIAIFASLAEAFATGALIFLPVEMQRIFIYFVMAFPVVLVGLFFIVLVFKNENLYAPSDFQDERNYVEAIRMKQSIRSEIDTAIVSINKSGKKLTDEDAATLKSYVEKVVNTADFKSNRREQILSYLAKGPALTKNICEDLNIHYSYATLILRNLNDEGIVNRSESINDKNITWSLNA